MSPPPKLKIKLPKGSPGEYIYDLEEARNVLNFSEGIFIVEGKSVHSYDALLKIVMQDKLKDREYIEVKWLQMIGGG
jgi:hypothetical protein